MPDEIEETAEAAEILQDYTCERCGFKYRKSFDYEPFLCYRCIRYMAKKTWTIVHTIQPTTSAPKKEDV